MGFDEDYAGAQALFGAEPERMLAARLADLQPGLATLDIGAGQGRNALFLARAGHQVHALEPSEVARAHLAAIADAEALPLRIFPDDLAAFSPPVDAYGAVLAFGLVPILTWPQIATLAARCVRWTAPGGLVFVTAFTTADDGFASRRASGAVQAGRNSFADGRGGVRTYLDLGELPGLFPGFAVLHHWEGLGPEHRHGDSPPERHALSEVVLRRDGADESTVSPPAR